MNSCIVCKGDLENKNTNFMLILAIVSLLLKMFRLRSALSAEKFHIAMKWQKQLEKIVNRMKDALTEVAIVHYSSCSIVQKTS